jgi:hypothetical protein
LSGSSTKAKAAEAIQKENTDLPNKQQSGKAEQHAVRFFLLSVFEQNAHDRREGNKPERMEVFGKFDGSCKNQKRGSEDKRPDIY